MKKRWHKLQRRASFMLIFNQKGKGKVEAHKCLRPPFDLDQLLIVSTETDRANPEDNILYGIPKN